MNFQFSASLSNSGYVCCPLSTLHTMLRLPKDVVIRAVRAHPDHADSCIIELEGNLPTSGELNAQYDYEHHTIITFREFTSRDTKTQPTTKP